MQIEIFHIHRRHEQGGVGEEVVHFLQGPFGGFWLDGPEEEGVCEVADHLRFSKYTRNC